MIIIDDIEQGTDEWKQLRAGVVTASNFSNIITAAKGGYSESADKYMIKLISEKLTGEIDETYSNGHMERGNVMEEEARDWYAISHDVKQVGFVFKDERNQVGCSPDGMNDKKGLEMKCVIGSTMVSYLLGKPEAIINKYKQQVQGSMFVTGYDAWDLLIYHPSFDPILITVPRDDDYCRQIEINIARFLKEMNQKMEKLNGK